MRLFSTSIVRLGAALGLAAAIICPAGAFAVDQFAADAYGTYQANAEKGKDSSPAQERAYAKWLEIIGEMPSREAQQVRRYHLAVHGYEA